VNDEELLRIAVRFGMPDNRPASADELALIAAFLPELMKEMLAQPETDEE
jgi:hypothetical protein